MGTAVALSALVPISAYFFKHSPLIQKGYAFVLSGYFLFFVAGNMILSSRRLSNKTFNILVYLFSSLFLFFFFSKYIQISHLAGDNICQLAYWKILFRPNLAGSIGAAYTKPGQLLVSGLLYELSTMFGDAVFKVGLCLVMAASVWGLVRIATDIGGRMAGLVALSVSTWAFLFEFIDGSVSIYLIPSLFIGLWLYYHNPKYKWLGRLLLACSIQFHIQSIAILGVIWLALILKRDWKELAAYSGVVAVSLLGWLWVILRVQGTFARLNSGAAAGYPVPLSDTFVYQGKFDYISKVIQTDLLSNPSFCFLLILAIIGIAGSYYHTYRQYLVVFSVLAILIANVLFLGGTLNFGRNFAAINAFGCSIGIGSILFLANKFKTANYKVAHGLISIVLALLVTMSNYSMFNNRNHFQTLTSQKYVENALSLLSDSKIPHSTRLMTEDDLLYPIVVFSPDRFESVSALQHFNILQDQQRAIMLSKTDYIWIALNKQHGYYYLDHVPVPAWKLDAFRLMVLDMVQTNQPRALYGYRFTPIDRNDERLILAVAKAT